MSIAEAPTPTSRRPASAAEKTDAAPKRMLPAAMIRPPSVSMRRGPSVSASVPLGSAMTTKQYG
jgi:hypothetical protein